MNMIIIIIMIINNFFYQLSYHFDDININW